PLLETIRLIVGKTSVISIDSAKSIAMIAMHRTASCIDRNLMVIHAQTVSLRITISEKTRLQHFVWAYTNTRHQITWRKGTLLNIRMEIFRVAIEFHDTHFNKRVIFFIPNLSKVKGMQSVFVSFDFWHNLNIHCPFRKIFIFDRV